MQPAVQTYFTYKDYLLWDDAKRYELIRGIRIEMLPAPSTRHQRISGRLSLQLGKYLEEKNKPCELFVAPFDVRLPRLSSDPDKNEVFTVVQPDLCIVCDPSKLDERGCLGAPDLVVEILSKNSKYDVEDKFELYEEAGVKEYWIIHPEEETLTVFRLDEKGQFSGGRIFSNQAQVKPSIFEDCTIDMKKVFEH